MSILIIMFFVSLNRYIAPGDSMISMSYAERLGRSTVSGLIFQTCEAIWQGLYAQVFPPLNEAAFARKGEEYFTNENFPNCMGSINGKHVVIQVSLMLFITN
jgi:hypothetical protein